MESSQPFQLEYPANTSGLEFRSNWNPREMPAAKLNDVLVRGASRWRPLMIGVALSVITALPASLLLFGTESEFASVVLTTVYAIPVLLYLVMGDPGVTSALVALVIWQFAVYGGIVSAIARVRDRKLIGWLLIGLHCIATAMALVVRSTIYPGHL